MDIGANLCSSMYAGIYKGKKIHTPDLEQVLRRARENGVEKIVVTIGSLKDLKFIGKLKEDPNIFFTIGIHPTNGQEFGPQAAKQIRQRFNNPKFVFYGEFGLDYDRLQLCPKEQQITAFKEQLVLAHESKLPLFLHCRNAADDFFKIINEAEHALKCKFRGVVHSFTGNLQELQMCTHHGFSVSLNGCGMKTQEQLNLIREIDIKQLMVETDCPYCMITPDRPSYKLVSEDFFRNAVAPESFAENCVVKRRNEPGALKMVCDVIAHVKGMKSEEVMRICKENAEKMIQPE